MPDIALRFHRDMLIMSASIAPLLAAQGADVENDLAFAHIVEAEAIRDAQRLQLDAGAQVLVLETEGFTPARLMHVGLAERLGELAGTAMDISRQLRPQHIVVALGPTGLPLDPDSRGSLMEHRDQFARAAEAFESREPDAFLLSGFGNISELKCALMGVAKVSGRPVMACINVDEQGTSIRDGVAIEQVAAVMEDLGASVAGFSTKAGLEPAVAIAERLASATRLPRMVQLEVGERDKRQMEPTLDNPYYAPATLFDVALALRAKGVQFLRAAGNATTAYTGALAAVCSGLDVVEVPAGSDASER